MLGVVYVYHSGSHHADCGTTADLILVYSCDGLLGSGAVDTDGGDSSSPYSEITLKDDRDTGVNYYSTGALNGAQIILIDGANAGHVRTISGNTNDDVTLSSGVDSAIAEKLSRKSLISSTPCSGSIGML